MKHSTLRARAARSRFAVIPALGVTFAVTALMLTSTGEALSAQSTVDLGNAASFGALSSTAMTNAGQDTVVHGNIGSSTSIDIGVTHPGFQSYGAGSSQLANAQASLITAYGYAEAQTPTASITGMNLAGRTFGPGVYNSTSDILISGPTALTLNGGGNPNAVFIFQAASSGNLTVDPTSSVAFVNGAQPCNVFWKVNSAFLKNSGKTFIGTVLALTSVTLTDDITVQGRLLARNADVTFIHDTVTPSACSTTPPTTKPPHKPKGGSGGSGGTGGSGGSGGSGGPAKPPVRPVSLTG
jgi:hypothetical protein